ncbi:hypothetical protein [Faecalibacterium prausnitzii]|uniref:hypothetical protein n=1 Tax=Faecalibacterium prausnitzii TaxID=853 RepID=UPI001CBDB8CE|nr:hypothetical protein [Faecalibacterium prausnitzii]
MKKLKRLAAVLLAGIMALALFTACSDSDPGNPEFDAKVESAYQEALKTKFEKELENGEAVTNDADIKRLAIEHIEEKHGADSLTGEMLWKTDGDGKTMVRQVMLCWELKKDTGKGYVPLFYEAAKTAAIKANSTNVRALLRTVNEEIANAKKNGITLELTALGVGAKTIGGKTYVAIGFELTNTTP